VKINAINIHSIFLNASFFIDLEALLYCASKAVPIKRFEEGRSQ